MLRDQNRGLGKATCTNRNTRNFVKRFAANTAFIGENEVEKTAQGLPCGIGDAASGRIKEQTTGEVPPPT
jgi:hypothetical protein